MKHCLATTQAKVAAESGAAGDVVGGDMVTETGGSPTAAAKGE